MWSKPIAGNVIPLAGSVKEAGYTSEEWKLVYETRKILHDDAIKCVGHLRARPGVRRPRDVGQRAVPPADAQGGGGRAARDAPGVVLVDDGDGYPTPLEGAGIDPVLVGRLREDPSRAELAQPLGHRRQPAQGRRAQRGPDGRGPDRPLIAAEQFIQSG